MDSSDAQDDSDLEPRLAVRRHTDRCFHRVEEIVRGPHGGYIVQGVLIPFDEVAQVVPTDESQGPAPACGLRTGKMGIQVDRPATDGCQPPTGNK